MMENVVVPFPTDRRHFSCVQFTTQITNAEWTAINQRG